MINSLHTLLGNLKNESPSLITVRVALVGDTATQFLALALKGVAVERGFHLDLFESEYNQVERQLLDTTSDLYAFNADYIIVFQSTHKLLFSFNKMTDEEQLKLAEERIGFVEAIAENLQVKIVYFNYPEIDDTVFGNYANKVERSFTYQIRKLNLLLMDLAKNHSNFFICDIAALQHKLGRDTLFHPAVYIGSEMVLSIDAIPYVASRAMDIIAALQGKFRKCLILDLDNTIWGGIVGDDGYEKLEIGHELGIGKAFTEFQQWVLKLKNRGVILAVCSKNDENNAREPFEKHPEMVLKLDDIALFIANWENKADNIRRIQSILNIGFDSMVFLDDNPFERNLVRENIPEITVPELPDDPALYLEYLYGLNLFETTTYSKADVDRTRQYQIESQRVSTQMHFTNEAEFLKNLRMVSEVRPFDRFNTPRVSQLSQRSNQFNLRTVRYIEADIEKLANDERYQNFSFTLADRFGDVGLICVVILEKKEQETLFIDSWFMSCRVLKRGMEHFTLNTLVTYARQHGFRYLVGEYVRTAKNSMVKDHYTSLGFTPMEDPDRQLFRLEVNNYEMLECYITTI